MYIPEIKEAKVLRDTLRIKDDDGRELLLMKAIRDEESGDMVATETLDAATWESYQRMSGTAVVDVKLPRFETKTDVSLKSVLSTLGMTDAFDATKADFSRFCNTSTFIEQMKQVARIVVDEKGSEAAAVTVIGSFTTSADSGTALQHVNFHANHPFLYVISEQSTGAILFIGQYFAE